MSNPLDTNRIKELCACGPK